MNNGRSAQRTSVWVNTESGDAIEAVCTETMATREDAETKSRRRRQFFFAHGAIVSAEVGGMGEASREMQPSFLVDLVLRFGHVLSHPLRQLAQEAWDQEQFRHGDGRDGFLLLFREPKRSLGGGGIRGSMVEHTRLDEIAKRRRKRGLTKRPRHEGIQVDRFRQTAGALRERFEFIGDVPRLGVLSSENHLGLAQPVVAQAHFSFRVEQPLVTVLRSDSQQLLGGVDLLFQTMALRRGALAEILGPLFGPAPPPFVCLCLHSILVRELGIASFTVSQTRRHVGKLAYETCFPCIHGQSFPRRLFLHFTKLFFGQPAFKLPLPLQLAPLCSSAHLADWAQPTG